MQIADMGNDELLRVMRLFNSYEDNTVDTRNEAQKAREYYDGKQWTATERATLARRKQPCITINRIAGKIDFVSGMESRSRTDPKAHPREPNDEPAAEVATAGIRYVCDDNDFDSEWSEGFEQVLIEGTTGFEVCMKPNPQGGEGDIKVRYIPWDRLVYDPHSAYHDFRDAKFVGEVVWMDLDDAIDSWPQHKAMLEESASRAFSSDDETTEDRPRWVAHEADGRRRLKTVHLQYRKGDAWWLCTFVVGGFLEEPMASPYLDRYGRPTKTIHLQSAKVDSENNRYGAVKHLIGPQDEINHRRSKALDLISRRQFIYEKGAIDDVDATKRELNSADGALAVNPNKRFEMLDHSDMAMGNFNMLAEAKGEIDSLGANAALTGKDDRSQSGRALQARQQGGIIELEKVFARMRSLKLRIYQAIWFCMRQFWSAERYIRISGDDNRDVHLALNKPVTAAEMLMRQGKMSPDQLQQIIQASPEMAAQLGQVVAVENNLGEMNVDIKLDEAPDFVTLAAEQFEQLSNMAASGVPIPPQVLIKASSLRNKQELLDMIEQGGATPEQQAAAAQQQQTMQAIQMQNVQLELARKTAELEKLHAETQKILAQADSEKAGAAKTVSDIGAQMRDQMREGMLPA